MSTPPGWYPFTGGEGLRYWDGEQWLESDPDAYERLEEQAQSPVKLEKHKDVEDDFNFKEYSLTRWIVSIIFVIVMGSALFLVIWTSYTDSHSDTAPPETRPLNKPTPGQRF